MNITLPRGGTRIRPEPQGHTPAMARNNVLLPEPLSPTINTLSAECDFGACVTDHHRPLCRRDSQVAEGQTLPTVLGRAFDSLYGAFALQFPVVSRVSSNSTTRSR